MQIINQDYELVAVDALKPHPRNPRKGDTAAIAESIQANGFYGAVVVQRSTGYILAGNHRLKAAIEKGATEVPVIWVDADDEQALRILLADNRTNDLAGYDEAALAEILKGLDSLEGTGYDQAAVNELVASIADVATGDVTDGPESQVDRADELKAKWGTALGQLWQIGAHRLMCGDSTDLGSVLILMGGERARLMATDPPYGVALRLEDNHEASNAAKGISGHYRHFERIMGDDLEGDKLQEFLERCFKAALAVLEPNAAWYLWHAQLSQGFFAAAAAAAAQLLVHRQIIWRKPHFVFGRGDYHWQHELCFYGWRQGNRPPFYGERNQTTVWDINEGGGSIRKDQNHPTQKPVELFAIPIRNHLKRGEACYEPFAGSGSQFVAAEQLGVRCFGVELEPKYVAVILERLSEMGLKPCLITP